MFDLEQEIQKRISQAQYYLNQQNNPALVRAYRNRYVLYHIESNCDHVNYAN